MRRTIAAITAGAALAVGLVSLPSASAAADTLRFDSTNTTTGTEIPFGDAGEPVWFAFPLNALESTSVSTIEVYFSDRYSLGTASGLQVNISTTASPTGSVGLFAVDSIADGVDCQNGPAACFVGTFVSASPVSLAPGTNYWTVISTSSKAAIATAGSYGAVTASVPGLALGVVYTSRDAVSSLGTTWDFTNYGYPWILMYGPSGGGDATTTSSAAPPPWLQSYGRAKDESCKTGWHPSWAEWAEDKSGGWVCNRTVYWNGSTWVQNPSAVWGTFEASQTALWDGNA